MRTLFLRELRRQLPIALALLALGAAILAAGLLLPGLFVPLEQRDPDGVALAAFALVAIATPFFLGVTSVAPDVESGGAAFLETLPFSRGRALAVRWGAAGLLSCAAIGVASIAPAALYHRWDESLTQGLSATTLPLAAIVASLLPLAAGFVASVAVPRALVACLVAPLFVALPGLAFSSYAGHFLGAPDWLLDMGAVVLVPVLLVAAVAAFVRGDVGRARFRPALIAAGIVGGGLVLAASAATAVYAFEVARCDEWISMRFRSADGRRVVESLQVVPAWHHPDEFRWRVVDMEKGPGPWETRGWSAGLSPDGEKVLVVEGEKALSLFDGKGTFESLDVPQLPAPWSTSPQTTKHPLYLHHRLLHRAATPSCMPSVAGLGLVWRGDRPVFLASRRIDGHPRTALLETDGRLLDLPGEVETLAGSRFVLRGEDDGVAIVDLGRGETPVPVALPGAFHPDETLLAPTGGLLFVFGTDAADRTVLLPFDLHGPAPVACPPLACPLPAPKLPRGWPDDGRPRVILTVSPSERACALEWSEADEHMKLAVSPQRVVEIGTGALLGELPPKTYVVAWSPSEKRLALTSSLVADLAGGHATLRQTTFVTGWPAFFADEDHLVGTGRAGARAVLDCRTLAVTVGDPWAKKP